MSILVKIMVPWKMNWHIVFNSLLVLLKRSHTSDSFRPSSLLIPERSAVLPKISLMPRLGRLVLSELDCFNENLGNWISSFLRREINLIFSIKNKKEMCLEFACFYRVTINCVEHVIWLLTLAAQHEFDGDLSHLKKNTLICGNVRDWLHDSRLFQLSNPSAEHFTSHGFVNIGVVHIFIWKKDKHGNAILTGQFQNANL